MSGISDWLVRLTPEELALLVWLLRDRRTPAAEQEPEAEPAEELAAGKAA